MSSSTGNILIAVLAGAVVGAGIGILLAPDKGSETRKKLKDNLGKGKDDLMDKYHELAQLLHRKAENAGENISEFLDNAISSGIHEKDELISLLEEKLELLKKGAKKATTAK
nr:YtxH domain-containing protein [uncultured Fluviicola sp.]